MMIYIQWFPMLKLAAYLILISSKWTIGPSLLPVEVSSESNKNLMTKAILCCCLNCMMTGLLQPNDVHDNKIALNYIDDESKLDQLFLSLDPTQLHRDR
jgi:hypothetical protein